MGLLDDIKNVVSKVAPKIEEGLAPLLPVQVTIGETIAKKQGDTSAHNQARAFLHSEVGHWFLSTPKLFTEMADGIYSKITGKNPHLLIQTNDMVRKLIGVNLYSNVPTTDEIFKSPIKALNRGFNSNDPNTIMSTLQIASKNPKTYHTSVHYLITHFINDFNAVYNGQAGTKTKSLLANEYNLLNNLAQTKQIPKDLMPLVSDVFNQVNNEANKPVREVIAHYNTINKAVDLLNLVGAGLAIFGGIGGKVADEGLAFAVSKFLEAGGATMMGMGTLIDAQQNDRPLSYVLSPVNVGVFADAVRGMKELPEIFQTRDALSKLRDPNFDITDWITNFYNPKTRQADLDKLRGNLLSVEKTASAGFKWNENFIKNLHRVIGDKLGVILDSVLSDHKKEQMTIKEAKAFIDSFYKADEVKEFFKPYIKPDGSVVIDDANEVEARLAEEAKRNPIINNFMKLVRQTRLISTFRHAIDNGNTEVQVFVHKLGEDEPIQNLLYKTTDPIKNIINDLEQYWKEGNNVIVKYKNRDGNVISRTIKATYHPTYDDFRIVRGTWHVLDHDNQWKDIEEDIIIPVHSIGDIRGAVSDVLRSKYQDVDLSKSQIQAIIKPASSIFPYKLNQIADRLVRLQNRLEKKASAEFSKHADILNDLKKSAIENKFLSEEEAKQIEYLPDLFSLLRKRINETKKSMIKTSQYSFDLAKQKLNTAKKSIINTTKNNQNALNVLKESMKPIKNKLKDTARTLKANRDYGNLLNKFENKLNKVEQTYWGIFKDPKEEKEYRNFIEQARNLGILPADKSVEDYLKEPSVEVLERAKNNLAKLYNDYIDTTKDMRNYAEKVLVDEGDTLAKLIKLKPLTNKDLTNPIKEDISKITTSINWLKEANKDYLNDTMSHMQNLINKLFISNKDYLRNEKNLITAVGKEGSKLTEIAETIQRLAKTQPSDMQRVGSGFAKVFQNYEDFTDYAKLKYLAPILGNFKSMHFLSELYDTLNDYDKQGRLNETQKLIKNFIGMALYKDPNNFAKAQRLLGSLITTLSIPISLSLSLTGFKNAHILFPSLDLAKIGEFEDISKAWMKEYKKFIYGQGIYKVNALNPFTSFPYALVKGHILANLKDDNIFNNVIKDYAKYVGLDSEDGIRMLKEVYKDDREKLAETLSEIATGSDPKSLLPLLVKYAKIGETWMPWYRYITAPFSISVEKSTPVYRFLTAPFSLGVKTLQEWKKLPEYIKEYGIGKALAKPLALELFTTALIGTQASILLGAPQTAYNIVQTGVSLFAPFFGIDKDVLPEGSFVPLIGKEIGEHFHISLLDPDERVNFYTQFGTSLLRMIASATGTHLDTTTAGKWFATGLNIATNLGSVNILSRSAGAYSADIPVPAFSLIKNILRPDFFNKTETKKVVEMASEVVRSVPALNNFYKDIVGKTVATHMGEKGHTDIYEPSTPQELLSEHAQGVAGLLHAIGFIALSFGDGVLNSNEANKVLTLIKYELHPDKYDSPIAPPNVSYIPVLNGRDYTIGNKPLRDLVGALNSLTPEHKQIVVKRFIKVMNTNIDKINELLSKETLTPDEADQLKQRVQSLQNMAIALIESKSVDQKTEQELKQMYNIAYKALQEHQIDIDYNDMLREKRELKK